MAQLKFDKKGNLAPQKISFKVKHDEKTKEQIRNVELTDLIVSCLPLQ